jgi:hypothetical protein
MNQMIGNYPRLARAPLPMWRCRIVNLAILLFPQDHVPRVGLQCRRSGARLTQYVAYGRDSRGQTFDLSNSISLAQGDKRMTVFHHLPDSKS